MNTVKSMLISSHLFNKHLLNTCQVLGTILGPRSYTVEVLLGFHKDITICQTLVGNGYVY